MKKLYFLFLLGSVFSYGQTQIGSSIIGEASGDWFGYSISTSSDGNVVAIGGIWNDANGESSGHVRVYRNVLGVWTKIGSDIDGDDDYNYTGSSVSLSSDGTILAIGAPLNSTNATSSGHVRVYRNISDVWTQIGSDINGQMSYDKFGSTVSLSSDGNVVAIGAVGTNSTNTNGFTKVYRNISGIWTQIGGIINGEGNNDQFGYSISLSSDGTILAIGAIYNNGNGNSSGHVRVYRNISDVWTQIGSDIDGEAAGDRSGNSVSLSSDGTILAIGAYWNDGNGSDSGHVRVYRNISDVWTQIGSDINGEAASDYSGKSVSLSSDGTVLAIGAYYNNGNGSDSGHVRVYRNISDVWTQIGVDINGQTTGDGFGSSVSLSSNANVLAIGAQWYGIGDVGQAKVYDLSTLLHSDTFVLDNFSIYPNPTSEILNITLENDLILEKVNIYNTLGQFIKSENKSQINISGLAKGNYLVEVITNQGKATKTIVME